MCTEPFVAVARAVARREGFESLPIVAMPHPVGGRPLEELEPALRDLVEPLTDALLTSPTARPVDEVEPRWLEAPGDPWEFFSFAQDRGWGDGLPLLPPTQARVETFLAAADRDPGSSLGRMPPSDHEADVASLAANAVMAGCRPDHLPIVIAAVQAVLDPRFNLEAVQSTTHPVTPLVIVHGEPVDRLGFNAGANVLGQGNRSNATVGRAVRLILQNVGGARPGTTDGATHGTPAKFSYCMAEDPSGSPWPSMVVERGIDPPLGGVTVVGAEAPHNVNDHGSVGADGLLTTIADTLAVAGSNNLYLRGQPLLVISPEHAGLLASQGYSRSEVQVAIQERSAVPVARISEGNMQRFRRIAPGLFDPPPADGLIPMLDDPEDLLVLVAGGPGKHSLIVPTFGSTDAVTVAIERPGDERQ